jgi:hypothetical protein
MNKATKITVSSFGTLMGLAGIEHGIGEILQGNHTPDGLIFPSWPGAEFFRVVSGEPAMSILPNLLLTGILATLFSMAYIAWATFFIEKKGSGFVMMVLSVAMLLTGGGIFPPVIGLVIAGMATQIRSPLTLWRKTIHWLGLCLPEVIWKGCFAFCWICWLTLMPGMNVFSFFQGYENLSLTMVVIEMALGSLLLTILVGFLTDAKKEIETIGAGILLKEGFPEGLQ